MPVAALHYRLCATKKRAPAGVALLLGLIGVCAIAVAAPSEPQALVEEVVANLYEQLRTTDFNEETAVSDMIRLFESEVARHIDFTVIARWIVGQDWMHSSAMERERFVMALKGYIIETYAVAFARGKDSLIELSDTVKIRETRALVNGTLLTINGQVMQLQFRLIRDAKTWKIIDIAIDGISLSRTLRSELQSTLRSGGIVVASSLLENRLAK